LGDSTSSGGRSQQCARAGNLARVLTEPTDETERRRTFVLLFVLGLVTVGVLVIVGLLALHNFHGKSVSSVLDSLTIEARKTTPAGSSENSVQRYKCEDAGDSGSPTVVRVLDVDRSASPTRVLNEVGDGFRNRHWSRTPGQVRDGGISLERGSRFAIVTRQSGRVYIRLEDTSILC
jgi:hypothetical protein